MSRLLTLILFSSFLLLAAWPVHGQNTGEPMPPGAASQFPSQSGEMGQEPPQNQAEQKMLHEQQKKLNQERQAELKRDTDKLLLLATQLKQAVDKSNENTLSLEVIRKAGEIEKLAKSVREKMRGQN